MNGLPDQFGGNADEADDVQPGPEAETLITSAINIFADLERERLALQREQQSLTLRGWEIADNGDQRNNETVIKRIESESEQDKRRHIQVVIAICLGVGVPVGLLALVLITALFGSERQSQIALDVLRVVGIALAGGGFIFGVAYAISRLGRGWTAQPVRL